MITGKILCLFNVFCSFVVASKVRPSPVFSSCTGKGVTKWNRDVKLIRTWLLIKTLSQNSWLTVPDEAVKMWDREFDLWRRVLQFGVGVLAAGHGECPGEVSQPPWQCVQPPVWSRERQVPPSLVLGQWHLRDRIHRWFRKECQNDWVKIININIHWNASMGQFFFFKKIGDWKW